MPELQNFSSLQDRDPSQGGVVNTAFQPDEKSEKKMGDSHVVEKGNGFRVIEDAEIHEESDDDSDDSRCAQAVGRIQKHLSDFFTRKSAILKLLIAIVLILLYFAYFIAALLYKFGDEGSWRLLITTIIAVALVVSKLISTYRHHGKIDDEEDDEPSMWDNFFERVQRVATRFRLILFLQIGLVLGFIVYVALKIAVDKPRNLISLVGIVFFIISSYLFSHNPAKVRWRPVFWGLSLQIIFGLLILRTTWGREIFQWLGDRVTELLTYADAGATFVFGELYINHFFAFEVLPVIVFFSTIVSMLYYLGVMQAIIKVIGRFLAFCLGTSATESINAGGNIFLGQLEAPLLIRPFLKDMTNSEIHAVMTGGFSTIAGSVMAAFIRYKVPASHLLSASVMSAPAALAMSKLSYPETEKSRTNSKDAYNVGRGEAINVIEAASNGASTAISLVANVAVNQIAFIASLEFINATLVWFGDRVGYDGFTFQLICSYVFWPIAYIMGVDDVDCRRVGELIGTKILLNEFVAYVQLSENINNGIVFDQYLANATKNLTQNLTGLWEKIDGDIYLHDTGQTLYNGVLMDRSVVIATYALCGFGNLASMGANIGGLGAMAPNKKRVMAKMVFRAMIAGNIACFITACISGLFYDLGD